MWGDDDDEEEDEDEGIAVRIYSEIASKEFKNPELIASYISCNKVVSKALTSVGHVVTFRRSRGHATSLSLNTHMMTASNKLKAMSTDIDLSSFVIQIHQTTELN